MPLTLLYLREESTREDPRYADMSEVPNWLRDAYTAERSSFLFHGADAAALEVHTPPDDAASSLRGVGVLVCPGVRRT